MSETGKNSWRMDLGSQNEDTPEYATKITINIHTSDDTPPALITAITGLVAEIIKTASSPAELEGIAEWLQEKRASHQRKADHAARMLLGEDVAESEETE